MRKHTCTAGETWCSLAFRYWTDEGLAHHIIAANPLLARRLVFEGGEMVAIPDKPADAQGKASAPPWRTEQ